MVEGAFAFGELLKLIVALGVTIGLFYALALFMKRMQVGTGRGGNMITVLAALPLGGKEKLWVVDVAGEKLVVGTSPGSVRCLHVLQGDVAGPSSFPRIEASRREGGAREASDACSDSAEAALDSRLRGNDEGPTKATSSSFPRRRESSDAHSDSAEAALDSRPAHRGNTVSQNAFATLLQNFRGGEKS